MLHTGTLYLSRTPAQASRAACGAFQLQMLLYDRLGVHHVEPWRVCWSGVDAQRFWEENESTMTPGTALVVSLEQARIHTLNCRPARSEVHANVISCALAPERPREAAHA